MTERRAANAKDHARCPECGEWLNCHACEADITVHDMGETLEEERDRALVALEDLVLAADDLFPHVPSPSLDGAKALLAEHRKTS